MPSYKLTYFDTTGRAELSRMIFAAADQKYEDVRIAQADWPKLKPATPQGTMPMLQVDGDDERIISQSMSIARYLARTFDFYGKDIDDMTIIDQILDNSVDVFVPFAAIVHIQDPSKKMAELKQFKEGICKRFLGYFEALVKKRGEDGFAVGKSLTVADLCLYVTLDAVKAINDIDSYPRLKTVVANVAANPKIAKYLKERKV